MKTLISGKNVRVTVTRGRVFPWIRKSSMKLKRFIRLHVTIFPSVKIPDKLDRKLASVARQHNRTKSDLLRNVLSSYLEKPEISENISALDLAGELVGSVDGPDDLSTNKKYLDDYGL